jgi:hypothetical protein
VATLLEEVDELSILSQPDCTSAWREAVRAVDGRSGRATHNVIIDIADPIAHAILADPRVAVVDEFLSGSEKSVETGANTIFPARFYRHYGAPALGAAFLRQYSRKGPATRPLVRLLFCVPHYNASKWVHSGPRRGEAIASPYLAAGSGIHRRARFVSRPKMTDPGSSHGKPGAPVVLFRMTVSRGGEPNVIGDQ